MDSEIETPNKSSRNIDLIELRRNIEQDKSLSSELLQAAKQARALSTNREIVPDITGNPSGAADFNSWKQQQTRGLEAIQRLLYFARIDTNVSDGSSDEELAFLVTEARGIDGQIEGPGWTAICWTNELCKDLIDKPIGHTESIPPRRLSKRATQYTVGPSVKARQYIPEVEEANYRLHCGEVYLDHEEQLKDFDASTVNTLTTSLPDTPPPIEYKTAESFGLKDIVVLADSPQREAMHLPFYSNVLIEGPPGSGKTSIGIMRIACLIDQQWDQLNLKQGQDKPFHTPSSMKVLVFNSEMVNYLQRLVESIGIQGVTVSTTDDFFRGICREAGTLSGRFVVDRPGYFARTKARRELLGAYWAGFQVHASATWGSRKAQLKNNLEKVSSNLTSVIDIFEKWLVQVNNAELEGYTLTNGVNLSRALNFWRSKAGPGTLASHSEQVEFEKCKPIIDKVFKELLNRKGIVQSMFGTDAYQTLLASAVADGLTEDSVKKADEKWREQYKGENPSYSEYDAMAAAWLGSKIALSSDKKPFVGGVMPDLTHIVVDEAQDLSPCHFDTLNALISKGGSFTLSGDLRQNLTTGTGIEHWGELQQMELDHRAFDINYRQSFQLGSYLAELHEWLFNEPPIWKPSPVWSGPCPSVTHTNSWNLVCEESAKCIRDWLTQTPGITVGLLYDRDLDSSQLDKISDQLEEHLSDILIRVCRIKDGIPSSKIASENSIVLASVYDTKGLEFDAVIYADPSPRWGQEINNLSTRDKNAFYVASSRAKQYLAIELGSVPEWMLDFNHISAIGC
tara:strand:+ start:3233 stop:5617 length:2385 start_codon:yes stop_codon:yes gene_type:complete